MFSLSVDYRLTKCHCHSWCPWTPFSTDNLLLLYKKQRRMKWLEVMDLDRDALPEIKKDKRMQETLFTYVH